MASTDFHLVTTWDLDASIDQVWQVLIAPETWPEWWPSVKKVEVLSEGDAEGIGAVRRLTWTTALPYELTFDMRTVRVEPKSVIEGRASGELDGIGRWTLTPSGSGCSLRYDWIVEVTKPWMVALAFAIKPVFTWNHGVVMERGRRGLVDYLARKVEMPAGR
jgi:uncharacterized protein YndB with AHSA1/START domain